MRQAFATGELTYCKVRAISRVATPETEEQLVSLGLHATGAQMEKLVRLYGGALAASTAAAQQTHERRSLTYRWNEDGSLALEARLPADEGALVVAALNAAEETSCNAQPDSAEALVPAEPRSARRADALVTIARSSLADTVSSADGEPCEINVHVDVNSLAGNRVHERCELADGPVIAPEIARRLSCDGSIVRIIERDGRPLSLAGEDARFLPPSGALYEVGMRSAGFPAARTSGFFTPTTFTTGRAVARPRSTTWFSCAHTTIALSTRAASASNVSDSAKLRFRRPDGCLIPETSPQRRAGGPGLERQHRARGMAIGAETCKPRSLGDPLDYGIAVEGLCVSTERALMRRDPPETRISPPEMGTNSREGPHKFPNRSTDFPDL